METMEVMSNEMDKVVEVVEMATPKTGNGLKMAGSAAGVLAVGFAIYKGVKWLKAKKTKKAEEAEVDNNDEPVEEAND